MSAHRLKQHCVPPTIAAAVLILWHQGFAFSPSYSQCRRCERKAKLARQSRAEQLDDVSSGGLWAVAPHRYEFPTEQTREIAMWKGIEHIGAASKPWGDGSTDFFKLQKLLLPEEVARILSCARQFQKYSTEPDTVDDMPACEYYPFYDGKWSDVAMEAVLQPILDERVLPYIREKYPYPDCAVGEILVRRYLPYERRTHSPHFDNSACVTANLGLCDPQEYVGGFFFQSGPHASSRQFPEIGSGDLLIHSCDLQHGVHLSSGSRYSLIMWLRSSQEAVLDGTTPWLETNVWRSDPHLCHMLGCEAHEAGELRAAARFFKHSAKSGHHWAPLFLGNVYAHMAEKSARKSSFYGERAVKWWRFAAKSGLADAQFNLATSYLEGLGVEQDEEEALTWMRQSAEQLHLRATHAMGEAYRDGRGVSRDCEKARFWFQLSASAGFANSGEALEALAAEDA